MTNDSTAYAHSAAQFAGFELTEGQVEVLEAYATWLEHEAIPAGGLGPREAVRLWGRHIGDSLVFAAGWSEAPIEILDIGSGVGLPGIPLAVLWPGTAVTLLDRGGRRTRLLVRAVRILGLENVTIAKGDAFDVADEWGGLTFRGAVTPPESVGLASRVLTDDGVAVLGLSRRPERPERAGDLISIAAGLGLVAELMEVPAGVLDGPAWLLRISR
jgi:16S rRNA (guanine527-N7)-methyltransferase